MGPESEQILVASRLSHAIKLMAPDDFEVGLGPPGHSARPCRDYSRFLSSRMPVCHAVSDNSSQDAGQASQ